MVHGRVSDDAVAMMRYEAAKKSLAVAYLLWLVLGAVGGHRFYLRRPISGLLMLLISTVSFILTIILIGYAGLLFISLWWLLDALLIPGMVARHNTRVIETIRAG
jgi:TM2 domain-containing membrane protein YozV